jgi:hypothetical protein
MKACVARCTVVLPECESQGKGSQPIPQPLCPLRGRSEVIGRPQALSVSWFRDTMKQGPSLDLSMLVLHLLTIDSLTLPLGLCVAPIWEIIQINPWIDVESCYYTW